jgi:hypothetical protein
MDTMNDIRIEPESNGSILSPSYHVSPIVDYKWKPKEDITAHELALCTPILVGFDNIYSIDALIDDLPDNARRHFEAVKG